MANQENHEVLANVRRCARSRRHWVRDMTLDYVLQSGTLKELGFSLRNGVVCRSLWERACSRWTKERRV
ncbi:OprD family outer membrane porin [Pseudomonas sp. IT-P253]|uniref:OprD family outer membrane porin n=1 Tax=Pseudomonas sp. IT-P253 TaxID=3026455 RepID=UPI0039DFF0B3